MEQGFNGANSEKEEINYYFSSLSLPKEDLGG
jgi:hypothetical protein